MEEDSRDFNSTIMSEISATQTCLSEQLQLLYEFGCSDLNMPFLSVVPRFREGTDWDADMHILEIIAVCLTTGQPGDAVAAAFDKRNYIALILAKNGEVTHADYKATTALWSVLTKAQSWIDLLPFLVYRSKANLDKRIRNLHQSFTETCDALHSAATEYSSTLTSSVPLDHEFPHSGIYRKAMYPDAQIRADHILHDLINTCTATSTFEVQQEQKSFVQLLPGKSSAWQFELITRLERLKRRLDRFCQYSKIGRLVKLAKRYPNLPFRWVEEDIFAMGNGALEICINPMQAVEHVLKRQLSPQQIDAIIQRFPHLMRNWEQRRCIRPCIHAELRIILHLSSLSPAGLSAELSQKYTPQAIGCSKRSCLCCALWIDSFKVGTNKMWVISGSGGKAYSNWALPSTIGEMSRVRVQRSFDLRVISAVSRRVAGMLTTVIEYA
ncbi:hypothetical protein Hypma_001498 [Hypsizygus marmoreus]|uniref:Uncharacterized protein n=1 Tax=Hypsizygus marmoreus TaxID=39966 RepID=A0A369K0U9_HYPMA|nr:hypothetical protein Hypma_001498 [Hypsizygus marmoreus]